MRRLYSRSVSWQLDCPHPIGRLICPQTVLRRCVRRPDWGCLLGCRKREEGERVGPGSIDFAQMMMFGKANELSMKSALLSVVIMCLAPLAQAAANVDGHITDAT